MNNIIDFEKHRRKGGIIMAKTQRKKKDNMSINRKNLLTIERKREIEAEAENIISKLDLKKFPFIDISSIVKNDGFEIKTTKMPIETTGCLFVNDSENESEKERLIVVNTVFKNPNYEADIVFKKSRFITAHEYGHFILHMPKDRRLYAHRDSDKRDEPKELEADYFARCILMPKKYFADFYELVNEFGDNDEDFTVEMLSKFFRVTKNKVKARMEDLLA